MTAAATPADLHPNSPNKSPSVQIRSITFARIAGPQRIWLTSIRGAIGVRPLEPHD
jgi:hypothetical protein